MSTHYGRQSESSEDFIVNPELIDQFHAEGCVTLENVLTESEVLAIEETIELL